jgi:CRISPR-associated protein Cas2
MYDICDPNRLRRVFKTMKGFGAHLQLSVFQCDLPAVDVMKMRTALTEIIHHTEDQVLIIDLGPTEARPIKSTDAIGKSITVVERQSQVV